MSRYLIDPHNITNYKRDKRELQTFWMFCVLVAGKNSAIQSRKLAAFLSEAPNNMLPFTYLERLLDTGDLRSKMMEHKLGQYDRLTECFIQTIYWLSDDEYPLNTVAVWTLEKIYGVGPKTARFFKTHTSEFCNNYAVLDTHVLRWMREEMGIPTPKATPSGDKYGELEQIFIQEAKRRMMSTADLDLKIWSESNKKVAA